MCEVDIDYLKVAFEAAKSSKCLRHRVGAILVKDGKIIVEACNNVPDGTKDCQEAGCQRSKLCLSGGVRMEECRGVHAEQNLIIQCSLEEINPKGASVYCTHSPCSVCAKMIANLKVKKVVYAYERSEKKFYDILKSAGVECEKIEL